MITTILIWILMASEQVPTEFWQPLIQGGSNAAVMGAIVVWFALRAEKILERMRTAMERNTNALMVAVLSMKHLDSALKPLAEKIERESAESTK